MPNCIVKEINVNFLLERLGEYILSVRHETSKNSRVSRFCSGSNGLLESQSYFVKLSTGIGSYKFDA